MNILQRIIRAITPAGDPSAPAAGRGTVAAGVDVGQVGAVEREEFEPDEHQDEESE